jgi:nucleotide-binding universal stress UspA family protein
MRVLLAVDGSPCSEAAVDEVARRHWPEKSEIRVVTINSPFREELSGERGPSLFDEINQRLRTEASRHLHQAVSKLQREAPQLKVTSVLRDGSPKDAILDEAEQWGADLIVVGSNGYGALKRFFLGSVSLAVATGASCSVEIVRMPRQNDLPRVPSAAP